MLKHTAEETQGSKICKISKSSIPVEYKTTASHSMPRSKYQHHEELPDCLCRLQRLLFPPGPPIGQMASFQVWASRTSVTWECILTADSWAPSFHPWTWSGTCGWTSSPGSCMFYKSLNHRGVLTVSLGRCDPWGRWQTGILKLQFNRSGSQQQVTQWQASFFFRDLMFYTCIWVIIILFLSHRRITELYLYPQIPASMISLKPGLLFINPCRVQHNTR